MRTVLIDGEPRFVAADACTILDIVNVSQAVSTLDDDEKGICNIYTPGGNQKMLCVTEPGLYGLVLVSRKPEAKAFKRWLKHDVIPSIRKTGSYSIPVKTYAIGEGTDLIMRAIQNEDRRHNGYFTMLDILVEISNLIHLDLLGMAPDSRMDISISKWWPKFCKDHGIDYVEGREQDYNIVNIKTGLEQAVFYYPNSLRDIFKCAVVTSYFGEGYFRKWAETIRKGNSRVMLIEEVNRAEYLVANPPKRAFISKTSKKW
jgi:hypothetical protein